MTSLKQKTEHFCKTYMAFCPKKKVSPISSLICYSNFFSNILNFSIADVFGQHKTSRTQQDFQELNDVLDQISRVLTAKENEMVCYLFFSSTKLVSIVMIILNISHCCNFQTERDVCSRCICRFCRHISVLSSRIISFS